MVIVDVTPVPGPSFLSVSPTPMIVGGVVSLVVFVGLGLSRLSANRKSRQTRFGTSDEPRS